MPHTKLTIIIRDFIWGGGQGGGHLPPPDFEKSDFLVFLPTKFGIFHFCPPPLEYLGHAQIFKACREMWSLHRYLGLAQIYIWGLHLN